MNKIILRRVRAAVASTTKTAIIHVRKAESLKHSYELKKNRQRIKIVSAAVASTTITAIIDVRKAVTLNFHTSQEKIAKEQFLNNR
jgi:hypothetical protein